MPTIRLRVEEEAAVTPCRYRDPQQPTAGVLSVPVLRLTAIARIEPGPRRRTTSVRATTALINTGAWLSVIETQAWEEYEQAGLLDDSLSKAGQARPPRWAGEHQATFSDGFGSAFTTSGLAILPGCYPPCRS